MDSGNSRVKKETSQRLLCVSTKLDDELKASCLKNRPVELAVYTLRYSYVLGGEEFYVLHEITNEICFCASIFTGVVVEAGFYSWRFKIEDFAPMAELREAARDPKPVGAPKVNDPIPAKVP